MLVTSGRGAYLLRDGMAATVAAPGRLSPAIEGLVTPQDVQAAHDDWDGFCETMHRHALVRAREIGRVARVHRDSFEPILPTLRLTVR